MYNGSAVQILDTVTGEVYESQMIPVEKANEIGLDEDYSCSGGSSDEFGENFPLFASSQFFVVECLIELFPKDIQSILDAQQPNWKDIVERM